MSDPKTNASDPKKHASDPNKRASDPNKRASDPKKAASDAKKPRAELGPKRSWWYRLVNRPWLQGNPLLHVAVMAGRRDWFDLLRRIGADPLVRDEQGMTLLHTAALMQDLEHAQPFLALALENGIGVNARDNLGHTALHLAVFHDKPAIMAWLLQNGANINSRTEHGTTPLRHAIRWRRLTAARHLLQAGSYVDERDRSGETPLLGATIHPKLAELLCEFGADVNACDHAGANLLHLNASRGNVEMVRWALANGVDRRATNVAGHTPLQTVQIEAHVAFGGLDGVRIAFADETKRDEFHAGPEAAGKWAQVLSLLGDPRFGDVAEA